MRFNTPEEVCAWADRVAVPAVANHFKYGHDLNPYCCPSNRVDWQRGFDGEGPHSWQLGVAFDVYYQRGAGVRRRMDGVL